MQEKNIFNEQAELLQIVWLFFWRKSCVPWRSSKIDSFYVHPFNAFCVDKALKNNMYV